ncbi:MAG: NAD+ synthase [Alphaproteobacteria bacterium]
MSRRYSIALAQLNPVVGDIPGNLARARAARKTAAVEGADVILFSELFISGYPPEDLVLKPAFQKDAMEAVNEFAGDTKDGGPAVLVGVPWAREGAVFNAVAHLDLGRVLQLTFKTDLPNYGVFDEKRVFRAGPLPGPLPVRGVKLGIPICEDIWTPGPAACLKQTGAEILLTPNGSPFDQHKRDVRTEIAWQRVTETGLPLVYVNQVGGQDELVFDGASFVYNADRRRVVQLPSFEEAVVITRWQSGDGVWRCEPGPMAEAEETNSALYRAMTLGLRDYVNKNHFPGVVLGLSGGIDSALSAAIAVDALGPSRVRCLMMASRYTAKQSLEDATAIARLLGVQLDSISIEPMFEAGLASLKPSFGNKPEDVTEQNLQSRIRGMTLMAISNKFGPMVLTTGNKSEMSVGYATLYGDMCGGYNAIKDLYKMQVYAVSRWRNQVRPAGALGPTGRVIPERVLERAPTAELRANQKDEDDLPAFRVLDGVLECLVEGEMSFDEIVAKGFDPAVVRRIEQMLYRAEYKRRQAAPGVKLSIRNFGRDRRYPITNAFRDAR